MRYIYRPRSRPLSTLDALVYAVGIIGPIMTLPQILLIWQSRSAEGVASYTWGAWALMDIPWIIYGVSRRDYHIALTYVLWFIGNMAVFAGALLF